MNTELTQSPAAAFGCAGIKSSSLANELMLWVCFAGFCGPMPAAGSPFEPPSDTFLKEGDRGRLLPPQIN
jgi:hypothetical protein